MEVGGRQEGAEVQGKTVHLKDGARRLPQVAARVRYARLMVVRAVVNNRHGQQGHFSNKPTPLPSGCVNTTPFMASLVTKPAPYGRVAAPIICSPSPFFTFSARISPLTPPIRPR